MSDCTAGKCAILAFRHETSELQGSRPVNVFTSFFGPVCVCRARSLLRSKGRSAVMSHILCESHVPTILRLFRLPILYPGIVSGHLSNGEHTRRTERQSNSVLDAPVTDRTLKQLSFRVPALFITMYNTINTL
jgi:hypothetical protein